MAQEITIVNETKVVNQDRDRCFSLILYCPQEYILKILKRRSDFRRAAWIVHNRDMVEDDDGNIIPPDPETGEVAYKEPHVHLVVRFGDGHTVSAVWKMFHGYVDDKGKETTVKVEPIKGKSSTGALRYLIHLDDPNKAQYEPTEVQFLGNAAPEFYAAISSGRIEYDPFICLCSGLASGKLKYKDILLNSSLASMFRDKAWAVERLVKGLKDEENFEQLQKTLKSKESKQNET